MPASRNGTGLLERASELDLCIAALRRAAIGEGSALCVVGAAGIGKTSLLGRAAHEAAAQGFRVLSARGGLLERDFAWGAVRQLFSRAQGGREGAAALADIALHGAGADAGELFSALHGLHWFALALAEERPLALLVDDAHWLDPLSLRWLAYLAARLAGESIFLLVAARPGAIEGDRATWAALLHDARRADLAPLGEDAAAALLDELLGGPASEAFAAYCHRLTEGNPFLLVELARGIRREGMTPDDDGLRLLRTQRTAVLTPNLALRIHRLGAQAVGVAHAAAVLGGHATRARIGALAELDDGDTAIGMERLAVDGLLVLEPAIEFTHPLMHSAAYQDLGAVGRDQLHARAARLLSAEQLDPDVIGGHLLHTGPHGDPGFVELLLTAAERALARSAPETAIDYFERALSEPAVGDQRVRILLELGAARMTTDPADAVRRFRGALEIASRPADDVAARIGLAQALAPLAAFGEAADVLEQGLAGVQAPELRDDLTAALLNSLRWDLDIRARCRPVVAALLARTAAGDPLTPELHANLAVELMSAGEDRLAAVHHAETAIATRTRWSDRDVMWAGIVLTPLACGGAIDRALEFNATVIEQARRRGEKTVLSVALAGNAYIKLQIAAVRDALADGDDALSLAADPVSTAYGVVFQAEALITQDRPQDAWRLLELHGLTGELPPLWPFPWLQATRGWLRFLLGDAPGGLAEIMAIGSAMLGFGLHCPAVLPWRSRVATIWAARGERDRALRLAELDVRRARIWDEPRTLASKLAVAGGLAEGDRQIELLDEALGLTVDPEYVLSRIETLLTYGRALRRGGQPRRAREHLSQARGLAQEVGALALLREVSEELRAAGARPRRTATRGPDSLTPSEFRVARLAAEGRSNREIAQLLFVTRRTVETHLTSAYAKLGVGGRDALADALS